MLVALFGENSFSSEPCAVLMFLSSQPNYVCRLVQGPQGAFFGVKSKHFPLEKRTQVTVGFLGEVLDRRDFRVLSLDVRKGTFTCASLITKYFRKPERWEEYL